MMRPLQRRSLWLLLPLLLALPLWFVKTARDQNTKYILSRFLQDPDRWFSNAVAWNRGNYENGIDFNRFEIVTTWFLQGDVHNPMLSTVHSDGRVEINHYSRMSDTFQLKTKPFRRLSKTQMEHLRRVISELPSNDAPHRRNEMLMMTFKRDSGRETRVYNRDDLPQSVRDVYRITGARLEEN